MVKLTDKLIAKLKKRKDLLNDIVNIAEEITKPDIPQIERGWKERVSNECDH